MSDTLPKARRRRQVQYKDEIFNASRLVQEDRKGFELWDTPKGQFWIPQASRYACWSICAPRSSTLSVVAKLHSRMPRPPKRNLRRQPPGLL